ncbi:MAG: glycoside hydrolase family 99-like domain-containing protein [Sulfurimonas sp.]|jgi:lipopolysaccharide biosynthesis protein|uniref:glycoside hydrolase family 99-like domain-containing protein n=1 Tax=Sulfurimonas sp. TaxID=2022749 RepID=UPI00260A44FC|nr:glycoside hydrolase family 99-like domain-containing protein [Sulfurimonas sp.]MDD3476761.1 glycoside hydrolase family 99-like domain-containing protein [Sulfurimonas sp.]
MFKFKKGKENLKNIIEKSGLFDKVYYLKNNHDVRVADMTPLEHYCQIGIKEDRMPNATFDPSWYKEYYTDVKADGIYPLLHFIKFGRQENRFKSKTEKDEYERLQNEGFDTEFYKNNYEDLAKITDTSFNCLLHYIRHGQYEGRTYQVTNLQKTDIAGNQKQKKRIVYETTQEAFDTGYYLRTYPDILAAGANPYEHYINYGWQEGRKPNNWFDPLYYYEKYLDVKESGLEPLTHFIQVGQFEKRETKVFEIHSLDESIKVQIPKVNFDSTSNEYTQYEEHLALNTYIKTVAFYLPQFHPFPENDQWWGKGFTEWTNVSKAKPNFIGHYQPHLPIHNGFYDLRVPEVMIEQAKLARNYGIHGFNFYYYWFDGKILMHKPFEILLKHPEIDINFCITWANENWTRRWDGAENDVLIGQNHCDEDSKKFIHHMFQYFDDKRYIRVDNKPVLIIYRANIIPNMKETVELWREEAKLAGYDGLYLICSQTFGITSPEPYGFDAAMEFPPHTVISNLINTKVEIINPEYNGHIYDYEEVVQNACIKEEPSYKMFRTAMLSWDNTARKQNNSHTFYNFSLLKYKQWLSNMVSNVANNEKYPNEEKFVFINAWNEWAEGTHLEPDREFGYGYLQTTYDVLKNYKYDHYKTFSKKAVKEHDIAVILHIHFTDLWEELDLYLHNLNHLGFDLFVTLTNIENDIVEKIIQKYPNAYIKLLENRGRDILPFLEVYKNIKELDYHYVCKIHSKKSEYRTDGAKIRNEIYDSLLGTQEIVDNIINVFQSDSTFGLITNRKYLIQHTEHNMTYDQEIVDDLCELLKIDFEYTTFPAGSMFWFKPNALNGIDKIENKYFQVEEGLADGTVAHSIERLFCNIAQKNNYTCKGL